MVALEYNFFGQIGLLGSFLLGISCASVFLYIGFNVTKGVLRKVFHTSAIVVYASSVKFLAVFLENMGILSPDSNISAIASLFVFAAFILLIDILVESTKFLRQFGFIRGR